MSTTEKTSITVEATINAPIEKVWAYWTNPAHIIHWNNASEDWFTPSAENDPRTGGKFRSRMEARDGSAGFDFEGTYDEVIPNESISYTLDDERKVTIRFKDNGNSTTVTETFDAEGTHSIEMQKDGWQAIMDNFKKYVEGKNELETLHFEIKINAGAEKVYHIMLEDQTYREWTALFSPGSYYEGSWEEGSEIRFLGPEENGQVSGMVGRIKENIPAKVVSIEHFGIINNGKEVSSGTEVLSWVGALENYYFREENGVTTLSIEVDTSKEYKDYFMEAWPKALAKLKEICES